MPLAVAAAWIGFAAYLNIADPPLADKRSASSAKNKVTLYNDGCCFVLRDFELWISGESGERHPVFQHGQPPYGKRLDADLPQDVAGPVQAVASFYYEYVTYGYVELPVMAFDSLDALQKQGLLLVFGDGDLKVLSGRQEAFFSCDKAPWADKNRDALNAYAKFLGGEGYFRSEEGREIRIDNEAWLFCEYVFHDMDGDGVAELLLRTDKGTYVLTFLDSSTIRESELSLLWADDEGYLPKEEWALLAPQHLGGDIEWNPVGIPSGEAGSILQ